MSSGVHAVGLYQVLDIKTCLYHGRGNASLHLTVMEILRSRDATVRFAGVEEDEGLGLPLTIPNRLKCRQSAQKGNLSCLWEFCRGCGFKPEVCAIVLEVESSCFFPFLSPFNPTRAFHPP